MYGVLVAMGNVVGGFLLTRNGSKPRNTKLLSYLIALGAGFMLAAVFIEVVPETVTLWTHEGTNGSSAHGVVKAMTLFPEPP